MTVGMGSCQQRSADNHSRIYVYRACRMSVPSLTLPDVLVLLAMLQPNTPFNVVSTACMHRCLPLALPQTAALTAPARSWPACRWRKACGTTS